MTQILRAANTVPHEKLHEFGASLSWCGVQETSVGVLRIGAGDVQ